MGEVKNNNNLLIPHSSSTRGPCLVKTMNRIFRCCSTAEFLIFCVIFFSLLPVVLALALGVSTFYREVFSFEKETLTAYFASAFAKATSPFELSITALGSMECCKMSQRDIKWLRQRGLNCGFLVYNCAVDDELRLKCEGDAMVDDGLTTLQEFVKLLFDAKEDCYVKLGNEAIPTDENGVPHETYCKGQWDRLTCWPNSAPGTTVSVNCPEYIEDFDHEGKAYRMCGVDGNWSTVQNGSQIWVDYSQCKYQVVERDPSIRSMILLYTVGYSCSLIALIFAVIILAYFKRLHCTRNFIHMHLFVSFILRAVGIFVKDRVLYYGSGILDISSNREDSNDMLKFPEEQLTEESNLIGCKIVITLFHYFVATNYYWILVEALYLHSLIFVAFFSDKKYLWRFTLTGWGVPVLFVVPWAIVRATLLDTGCWDIAVTEFKWIYNGPIVVANVINFLLFLNIIRVLWSKMRDRGSVGKTDNSRQYKKLAKSTLILIPMFGVHAIVFIGMPDNITSGIWWDIRMYFDLFFNSFQGFFVAIIYCFCNGEVQTEFKKAWDRFHLSVEIRRGRTRDRSRSSVTMMTSFNSSASQQARLSIGGQSNNRGAKSNGNGSLMNSSGQNIEGRHMIVQVKSPSRRAEERETTFVERSENCNIGDKVPLLSPRPPFIRAQSSTLVIATDVILPIKEEVEPDLEEALNQAVESHIACPAGSFGLADDLREDSRQDGCISGGSLNEMDDDFEDVISCDETKRLREKREQRCKRAASQDSGISSTSTFYSTLRGRNRNTSASNSEYFVDSEGYAGDDVKRLSDVESCRSNCHVTDVTIEREEEASKREKNILVNKGETAGGDSV